MREEVRKRLIRAAKKGRRIAIAAAAGAASVTRRQQA